MKATNRLYINITNKCNINCPYEISDKIDEVIDVVNTDKK